MMQSMRDNMKVIIWVTAIVFLVGFGILQLGGVLNPPAASGPAGVIAKVNGEPIRYEEFMAVYQNGLNQVRAEREVRPGEDSYIREQAWEQILQQKLMQQEVRRRHIRVTADEIKTAIRFAPPDFVIRAPGFQTNGQFDYKKYLAELDNPNSAVPWAQVEAYVAETLPQQKLQEQVISEVKVSEADVRDRFLLANEKIDARFLYFPIDSFQVDTTQIGGADIETYYRSHPDEFSGPPEVKLQVSMVPRRPRDPDFAAAIERMRGIRDQLLAQPDSFAKYARTYSEISSAQAGGETGDAPYVNLRPKMQAALKLIQPGQLSQPVQEERSVHLFRLDKRWADPKTGMEMVHYHEIAFRVEPSAESIREARKGVDDLIAAAKRNGLAKAATSKGFQTTETPYFREGNSRNQVFQNFPELETWAFQAKVGSVSHPVPSEMGWYVYQILDREKAGLRSIGESRLGARALLIMSLQIGRATDAATQARAALLGGMPEAEVAKRFHASPGQLTGITRSGYLGQYGAEPKIVGSLFTVTPGSWSAPLVGKWSTGLAFVTNHARPTEEEYRKQAPQVRQQLLNEGQQLRFSEWLKELRKRARIEDYRENYFEA